MASRGDSGESGIDADSGTDAFDSADTDSSVASVPIWYKLGASLGLSDSLPSQLTVSLDFFDENQVLLPLCSETREAQGILAFQETPDPSIYHWWELTLSAPRTTCDTDGRLPSVVMLGLGSLHPEVEAQMLSRGLDDVTGSLYGAYALLDTVELATDPVDQVALAYGYAGTLSDLEGRSDARSEGPVPDGEYEVEGVFLFPLMGTD